MKDGLRLLTKQQATGRQPRALPVRFKGRRRTKRSGIRTGQRHPPGLVKQVAANLPVQILRETSCAYVVGADAGWQEGSPGVLRQTATPYIRIAEMSAESSYANLASTNINYSLPSTSCAAWAGTTAKPC